MPDPSKLHAAVLGPEQVAAGGFTQRPQPTGGDAVDELFQLWVHRLAMINATVAATLTWKLVRLAANPDARRRLERDGARRLSKADRSWIERGAHDDHPAPASIRKATRYRLDDAVELVDHPAIDLLQRANPWTDGYGMMEATFADLQLFADAYWFVATGEQGRPTELWRMMPDRIDPVADTAEFVRGFTYRTGGGKRETFATDEVVWFRRYSPTNPYRGVSELDAWRPYAKASHRMAEFNTWLFERNGTPDHLVVTPHKVSEKDKRAFRTRWRQLFGRLFRRQETVAFLEGDVRLEKLGQAPRELEFSESSRMVRDFLCAGFGVPKAMVTPEDANRAVTREATDQHLRLTVWPLACRVFDTVNEQLLPMFGEQLLLVPDNPIRTDAATRAAERTSKLSSGYSVNEVRREDGAEPLDDPNADKPMVGGGVRPLDQAAAPPPAPFAFGTPPPGQDEAQDDDEGDQGDDEAQDDVPAKRGVVRPCACAPAGVQHVKASDLFGIGEVPDLGALELLHRKAAEPDDPEDVRLLAAIARSGIRQLRSALGAAADAIREPEQAAAVMAEVTDDAIRTLTAEANSGLSRVVTASAQSTINGLRPGFGLAFNSTNPLVVEFVESSAARIADTVATAYTDATVRQLRKMITAGTNPRDAARELAATNRVEDWMARRLARTEARFASTFAQTEGMAQSGVVEAKRFQLSSTPCDICQAVDDHLAAVNPERTFPVREPMFPNGFNVELPPDAKGNTRTFTMDYFPAGQPGPPIHPNCRCTMRAVLIGG